MFNKTIFTQRTKNGKDFFMESKIKKKGIRVQKNLKKNRIQKLLFQITEKVMI